MQNEEKRATERRIKGPWEIRRAQKRGSSRGSDYQIKEPTLHQRYFSMEMKALLAGKGPNLLFLTG